MKPQSKLATLLQRSFSANFIGRNGFIYYVFANQDKGQYKDLINSNKSCLELTL